MDVTLRQLRYFLAVYEHRHFGRAAAACAVSQPALSVQVKELETALGAALIDREGRGFAATPLGHEVARQARRVMAELDALTRLARAERGLEGPFALGVIPTVAPYLLPPALAAIRRDLPALDLRVREAKTDDLLGELAEGRLDACVLATEARDPALEERPLFDDRFLLAAPEATAEEMALRSGRIRLDEVARMRLLLLDEGHCLRDQALAICNLSGRDARLQMGASSMTTLLRLIAGGFGATLAPGISATEAQALPGVRLLELAAPAPSRRIRFVTRRVEGLAAPYGALASILAEAGETLASQPV